jgi:hypothetical protein
MPNDALRATATDGVIQTPALALTPDFSEQALSIPDKLHRVENSADDAPIPAALNKKRSL